MAKPKPDPRSASPHKVLAHPLRSRILLSFQRAGQLSPIRFSASTKGTNDEIGVNVAAYHFRVLARYDVIELVDRVRRRGATENVYKINPESPVPGLVQATELLRQGMQEEVSPTPDGSSVTILPAEVDEQGLSELQQLLSLVESNVKEIAQGCSRRLDRSKGDGISIRVGLATFGSESDA